MERATFRGDDGFSLVELVIAMFLLAVISLAILPLIITGLRISAEQATVAAATRTLNALVEEARADPTCTTLAAVAAPRTFQDGRGTSLTSTGLDAGGLAPPCTPGELATIDLRVAPTAGGAPLAETTALVFIPTP